MLSVVRKLRLIEATGVLEVDLSWLNGNYQRALFRRSVTSKSSLSLFWVDISRSRESARVGRMVSSVGRMRSRSRWSSARRPK